jgi:hypothetical protein
VAPEVRFTFSKEWLFCFLDLLQILSTKETPAVDEKDAKHHPLLYARIVGKKLKCSPAQISDF